jgi:hypothetical protein
LPALRKALGHVQDPAERAAFRALEPSNGWGTLTDAEQVFRNLIHAAEQRRDAVWTIR